MTTYIYDVETTGLNPATDRILCISVCELANDNVTTFIDKSEKLVLEQFWAYTKWANKMVGFNSNNFDIQFILARSVINNVKISEHHYTVKYIDVRELMYPYNNFMKGCSCEFAAALGISVETENGSHMLGYYHRGEWDEIKAHCSEDTLITKQLFLRLRDVGIDK